MKDKQLEEFIEEKAERFMLQCPGGLLHSWASVKRYIKDFIRSLLEEVPMRKPKVSKKRIIEIQNLLLDVSKEKTGVFLAMARITGWLIEAGYEVEK